MSGPKSATYYLTAAQRAELAKQRQLELQRRREAERKRQEELRRQAELRRIQKLCDEERAEIGSQKKILLSYIGTFEKEIAEARELFKRSGQAGDFEENVKALEAEIKALSSEVIPCGAKLEDLKKITSKLHSEVSRVKTRVSELKKISNKNNSELITDLEENIAKGYSLDIEELLTQKDETIKSISIEELSEAVLSSLIEWSQNEALSDETRRTVLETIKAVKEISDVTFLKNYGIITVLPLLKKCKKEADEYEKCQPEYEDLTVQYITLCEYAKKQPETVKCTFAGIAFLKKQIAIITEEIEKSEEESYISNAVDEVMAEMGYDILGYRNATRHGASFRHDLYRYSDGTAIDVTFSSDGKIAMELGGLDKVDRTPDTEEAESLCREMESFCSDYAEIERRLAEKGVIMGKRLSMLPPSVSYAQIINANDYKLKKTVEKFTAKKERRTAAKKQADRKDI